MFRYSLITTVFTGAHCAGINVLLAREVNVTTQDFNPWKEQSRISKWFSHSFIIYQGDAGINVELAVSSVSSLKYHVQEGILLLFFYGHVNPLYKTTA